MKFLAAALAGAVIVAFPVQATNLPLNAGWQDDTLDAVGSPTENSPWTFTISSSAWLSVVDCCISGDTYTLSGDVTGVTTFYAGSASDVQASGSYGSYWTDASYSKLAQLLAPGSYSFSITGDGVGGIPAGLGVRLDSAAVPEAATWALMLVGFGGIGVALRRSQRTTVSFA